MSAPLVTTRFRYVIVDRDTGELVEEDTSYESRSAARTAIETGFVGEEAERLVIRRAKLTIYGS